MIIFGIADGDGLVGGLRRHDVLLGADARQRPVGLRDDAAILIAGSSGIGKSRLASAMIERAELRVHRNSTLKAGVIELVSSRGTGQSWAISPHSSG